MRICYRESISYLFLLCLTKFWFDQMIDFEPLKSKYQQNSNKRLTFVMLVFWYRWVFIVID